MLSFVGRSRNLELADILVDRSTRDPEGATCDTMVSPSSMTLPKSLSKFYCFVPNLAWHRERSKTLTTAKIFKSPLQRRRIANIEVRKQQNHWPPANNEKPVKSTLLSMVDGERQGQTGVDGVLEEIRQRLERELPGMFTSDSANYEMYSRDVLFEDPLNKFRGTKRYASNISFLKESPVFTNAKFYLHSSGTLPERNVVRTRWTLQMTVAALPWKPTVVFTGLSDYRVDPSSKMVVGHFDYWDSLSSSGFFSPPAVVDLVSQCTPGSVLPFESLPSFVLLRRTQRLQVWKFDSDVTLIPVSNFRMNDGVESKTIFQPVLESTGTTATLDNSDYENRNVSQQNAKRISRCVAVARVSGDTPSHREVQSVARTLRSAITDAPFTEATDDSWLWVRTIPKVGSGKRFNFVWIELSGVNMNVEKGTVS